ncbi:putative 26S proteasome regulatory subunit-like protein [Lachnellula suecica]|uniref:Putative 26S proteasome regulatory subunit-like protein n=1 Tax=Lachnellula suecica TaxID=602035 RepID=A0A8T9CJB2_9HELO|nr:putative 26S proteasome regulatory subunit-like protein [Lachnellula suecica]
MTWPSSMPESLYSTSYNQSGDVHEEQHTNLSLSGYARMSGSLRTLGMIETMDSTPLQRFIGEPLTSQPYNAVSSFVPFSTSGSPDTLAPHTTYRDSSMHCVNGSSWPVPSESQGDRDETSTYSYGRHSERFKQKPTHLVDITKGIDKMDDGYSDSANYSDDMEEEPEEELNEFSTNNFSFLKPPTDVPENSAGLVAEIKLYEARYNHKNERHLLEVGKHKHRDLRTHRDHDSALVFSRYYNTAGDIEETQLTIRSPYLKQVLKEVIKEYPGINLKAHEIVLQGLPKCLFHYRVELQAHCANVSHDSEDFIHLLLLLKHMWEQLESQWINYSSLIPEDGYFFDFPPGLDFLNLWMVFRPGDLMYTNVKGHDRVVKMSSMLLVSGSWVVEYIYIADDGKEIGYAKADRKIEHYGGFMPLERLTIFPLKYHSSKDIVTSVAIARGQKYISLRGTHYRMYEGKIKELGNESQRRNLGQWDNLPSQTPTIKSRIMIDTRTFYETGQHSTVHIKASRYRLPKLDGTDEYMLSNEDFILCDHQVPGFSLAEKNWCWWDVDKIIDVELNTAAFERLLLPQEQKDMIYSLVEVHTNHNLSFDDVIKGKGKGMIFLLHGVPGTGKTLTAESVADQTQRPLYTISSGELGTSPASVERSLKAALDLATKWNAIVLLDEADVFLEQRSMQDLERNSLVSIFLRLLEYYEGILILTTNRIEAFDQAFKSRIHLAVKYNALPAGYRIKLWKTFISNTAGPTSSEWLSDYELTRTYPWTTEEYLGRIGREVLNGRQIKNTVRTANALAVSAGQLLSPVHIDTALRAMKMFESDFAEIEEANQPTAKRRRVD